MTHKQGRTAQDSHYARLRRQHRERHAHKTEKATQMRQDCIRLYGLHTVAAAIANPQRKTIRLMATKNAFARLETRVKVPPIPTEFCQPHQLDRLLGEQAVHQGVMLEATPLVPRPLSALGDTKLIVVLDQVSDPHNVGALIRSSVAFKAGALITTARHAAQESGVLAKSASGALEQLDYITVGNLAQALQQLHEAGFTTIGLDSQAKQVIEQSLEGEKIALVLGNEGKGLRHKTRNTVKKLARLDMPGMLESLNVSNAGAVALYVSSRFLQF